MMKNYRNLQVPPMSRPTEASGARVHGSPQGHSMEHYVHKLIFIHSSLVVKVVVLCVGIKIAAI